MQKVTIRKKAAYLLALLFLATLFPTKSSITVEKEFLWTTRYHQQPSEVYYFQGNMSSFFAGNNRIYADNYRPQHWDRVRFGYPFRSITLDINSNEDGWHMYLEAYTWLNMLFWFFIWFMYQLALQQYYVKRGG